MNTDERESELGIYERGRVKPDSGLPEIPSVDQARRRADARTDPSAIDLLRRVARAIEAWDGLSEPAATVRADDATAAAVRTVVGTLKNKGWRVELASDGRNCTLLCLWSRG
jgi:hypothetical protein